MDDSQGVMAEEGDIMKFIGGMIAVAIVGLIFYVGFIVIRWLWRMHQ